MMVCYGMGWCFVLQAVLVGGAMEMFMHQGIASLRRGGQGCERTDICGLLCGEQEGYPTGA